MYRKTKYNRRKARYQTCDSQENSKPYFNKSLLGFLLEKKSSLLSSRGEIYQSIKYIEREQPGSSKTNRMAVNRLKDHTGGKKHSAKVR